MAEFTYRVRDTQGRSVTGVMERESQAAGIGALRQQGLVPISVEQRKGGGLQGEIKIPGLSNRVKLKDIAVSSRQLATMINAGLPLLRAVTVLAEQTESKPLAKVWSEVRVDVETGASFSGALAKPPKAFSNLYTSMVRAGEVG